ncbi:radical SAM protein [bacterium]|nr:radical SAM protein [bacterium]
MLVYAPLRKKLFPIKNKGGYKKLTDYFLNNKLDPELEVFLKENGLSGPLPKIATRRGKKYEPINLILSLTSNCNLRCKYCYAFAGDTHDSIPWETIQQAIKISIKASRKVGKKTFKLLFHGGGEATVEWNKLQKATEEVKRLWNNTTKFSLVTNGTLITDKKAKWLKENNFHITVSLDGPKDVHDLQRVKANGRGSFDDCIRGMLFLEKHHVDFSIRATITQNNIHRIKELLLIAKAFGCSLKVEPLTLTGRATKEMIEVSYKDFFLAYNDAKKLADQLGVIFKSTYSHKLITKTEFCAGNGEMFCVLPDGQISSCTRVTRSQDELSNRFIIGNIDSNGDFHFDHEKVSFLRGLSIQNFKQCHDCFAKWYCTGGCHHTRLSNNGKMSEEHCLLTKAMLFNILITKLEA